MALGHRVHDATALWGRPNDFVPPSWVNISRCSSECVGAMTASEFLSVFHHVSTGSWGYSGILTDCMYMGETTANDRALDCRTKGALRLVPTHHLRRYRAYTGLIDDIMMST